jgi:hypothetical protein
MIDRPARNKLAEEIRHFVAGLTDNFVFDNRVFAIQSQDAGVINIRHEMWFIYDDLSRHKLKGKWSLSTQDKAIVSRCILFLKSDAEYSWPNKQSVLRWVLKLLTFGFSATFFENKWKASGSWEVWPFLTTEEFDAANRNPAYLN